MESRDEIEILKAQLQQLRKAVEEGRLAIVDEILDDEKFKTAFKSNSSHLGEYQLNLLNTAAYKYYAETVEKLIAHGITPNVEDRKCPVIQPLWYAIINGRDQIAKILINAGANVNRRAGDHCHFDSRGRYFLYIREKSLDAFCLLCFITRVFFVLRRLKLVVK